MQSRVCKGGDRSDKTFVVTWARERNSGRGNELYLGGIAYIYVHVDELAYRRL